MTTLMHVNASPRSANSQSLAIASTFLDAYRERRSDLRVDTLDLFDTALPPFGTDAAEAKTSSFFGREHTPAQAKAWDEARGVFDRFAAADEYLVNVPMWNHGVPYALKHWIDIITQPGWAFGLDPQSGYFGLLEGKRAVVVYTSGVWSPGVPPSLGTDFHSTYFDDWLRFVGITDITELRFNGSALMGEAAEGVFETAQKDAAELGAKY